MKKRAIVIGAGFSGLATATYLADSGFDVTILEKNESIGGRARRFSQEGYTFDMGPSWYWMPDVFEEYFKAFGKNTTDYYELIRLDPSYRVVFGEDDYLDIPAEYSELKHLFNQLEEHSGEKLDKFLDQAAYKYKVGINDLVYKPSRSITEFLSLKLLIDVMRLDVFVSFEKHIKKIFPAPKNLTTA
jgi:phytoene desaturase